MLQTRALAPDDDPNPTQEDASDPPDGLSGVWGMAAKHFSLLTERVELVDQRHVEEILIEARDRAAKAGHK